MVPALITFSLLVDSEETIKTCEGKKKEKRKFFLLVFSSGDTSLPQGWGLRM